MWGGSFLTILYNYACWHALFREILSNQALSEGGNKPYIIDKINVLITLDCDILYYNVVSIS